MYEKRTIITVASVASGRDFGLFIFSKGPCFGCAPEAATLTVMQTDTSSWMERNQDYGACKSASRAAHVKISYREKLTECCLDCTNEQRSSLRRDTADLRRSHTHPVSAAPNVVICQKQSRGFSSALEWSGKLKVQEFQFLNRVLLCFCICSTETLQETWLQFKSRRVVNS